jgi:hypothetical protein
LREQTPRPEIQAEFDSHSEGETDSEETPMDLFPRGDYESEDPVGTETKPQDGQRARRQCVPRQRQNE